MLAKEKRDREAEREGEREGECERKKTLKTGFSPLKL